jgi:hypothetical protein
VNTTEPTAAECVEVSPNSWLCRPPQGVVRRHYLTCWNCERKRRVVEVWQGAWYPSHFYCCACGDGWGDEERMERPFLRGWRPKAIAKARAHWAAALTPAEFNAWVDRDLQAALG